MKWTKALGMIPLMTIACGAEPQEPSEHINVDPTTLAEAAESLSAIERRLRESADEPFAHEALAKLRPRLDELNHLVARVEVRPGQFVSFYESEPGVIGVSESGPMGAESVVEPSDLEQPLVSLYERLSGGRKAPLALVQAEARARVEHAVADLEPGLMSTSEPIDRAAGSEQIARTAQALTEGDGPWFRDNGCFETGDARACFPNSAGNSWADYNTRTSFLTIAPYRASGPISISLKYQGTQRYVDAVFEGQWNNYQWFSGLGGCGFWACVRNLVIANHRWDILNADGKAYHWSFAAKWNCDAISCKEWPRQ
jgi:hypothetical protein